MAEAQSRVLVLMRHAKSAWGGGYSNDSERPLDERGRRAAPVMASYLADAGGVPDLVLCSNAVRARQTLDRMLHDFTPRPEIRTDEGLYLADQGEILARIRAIEAKWRKVLVIGHNPGLQHLAGRLMARAHPAEAARVEAKFPTAGLVHLAATLESWETLSPDTIAAATFVAPKHLV
jgi:phosphohistidine phosphatase